MSTIPSTRRLARVSTHGNLDLHQAPLPAPQSGEMVVRTLCSLISPGTELQWLRNPRTNASETWIEFGYQCTGIVAAVNNCPGFAIGDRVSCLGGGYAQHSPWNVVPCNLAWKLPDTFSDEEGAFANLLGTALNAVRRAHPEFGGHMAVVGLGVVGQLSCQLATLCGMHVIAVDRVAMRRELAAELADAQVATLDGTTPEAWKQQFTRGYGLDSAVVAFGGDASAVLYQLAAIMRTAPDTHGHGRIVLVGGTSVQVNFPGAFGNIDICSASRTGPGYHDETWERGANYPEALVPWNTRRNVEECLRFIAAGKLQVNPMITHRIGQEQIPETCRAMVAHPDEYLGVIVTYPH